MQRNKTIINVLLILAIVFAVLVPFTLGVCTNVANAEDNTADVRYTNVLVDLYKDDEFNVEDYPNIEGDYSLHVIQIAESADKELFVYVYNPSADRIATSISISTAEDNPKFKLNKLDLINSYGVFSKYKADNLTVKDSTTRYYEITEIFRKFDNKVDKNTGNDNTINEISYQVAKAWTATTENSEVTYTCKDTETILITNKYVGYLKYWNGFNIVENNTDSHYVAFSTDRRMDKLMEADVAYVTDWIHYESDLFGAIKEDKVLETKEGQVTLYANKNNSNTGGLFAKKYTWPQIQSVADFKANKELNEEATAGLEGKQWVLNFLTTEHTHYNPNLSTSVETYYKVIDVTILRLMFETDGQIYNLGVVDNKQTGSSKPSNQTNKSLWDRIMEAIANFVNDIKTFLFIIGGIIVFAAVVSLVKSLFGNGG